MEGSYRRGQTIFEEEEGEKRVRHSNTPIVCPTNSHSYSPGGEPQTSQVGPPGGVGETSPGTQAGQPGAYA